jgi:hypothetical protein
MQRQWLHTAVNRAADCHLSQALHDTRTTASDQACKDEVGRSHKKPRALSPDDKFCALSQGDNFFAGGAEAASSNIVDLTALSQPDNFCAGGAEAATSNSVDLAAGRGRRAFGV